MDEPGLLRIGELSRRSGVSPELLRAWERRYELLRPTRSPGGLRLYSLDDLDRVRAMQHHLSRGLAAAEAAALTLEQPISPPNAGASIVEAKRELCEALAAFDEPRAQAVIDSLLAAATIDTLLAGVVMPYLNELGDRWEQGEASVAEEHFASSVLRGRLLGLARGWGRGLGPRVVLACAPGEQHDLGLLAFGLALRARGWRIVYLGTDTPITSAADAAHASDAVFVVVTAVSVDRFHSHRDELVQLARKQRLFLAGAGAHDAKIGADFETLTGGPVDEAERLTGRLGTA